MLLAGMDVAHHHCKSAVSEHRRECNNVNACLCCAMQWLPDILGKPGKLDVRGLNKPGSDVLQSTPFNLMDDGCSIR